jgi:type II pantothenate kinase
MDVLQGRQGTLHFIHFPTSRMRDFIDLVKAKGFTQLSSTVCATGGGAHKFEQLIHEVILGVFLLVTRG